MRHLRLAFILAIAATVAALAPSSAGRAFDSVVGFGPAEVAAASPTPPPAGAADPRSAGEGPGLVGRPLVAIGGVLGLGILTVIVTVAYVRLTRGNRPPD